MKKSNFKFNFQMFVIIMLFIGFLYFFNITRYRESVKSSGHPCYQVADDDRCNKRNDCTWFKGECTKWRWGPGMRRTCVKYSTQYCTDK
jgi:hypothetical protein